ncbi:MAG: transketolase, partial [Candidatus Omnitrophica bacterium]|nr:transketolase [Candidatus Omnitrophota bacterium]
MSENVKVMRDVLISGIHERMLVDKKIFFLSADFGAPVLDALKDTFKDRFINVGIAEQNLINVSTGLALEGFTVFAYAIAPFITMRAYEQVRVNLALHAEIKELNVNLIGVGAGLSYDISGPTHHSLEDLAIMRLLPNVMVFSPSDCVVASSYLDVLIKCKKPKYIRLDGKPVDRIYQTLSPADIDN